MSPLLSLAGLFQFVAFAVADASPPAAAGDGWSTKEVLYGLGAVLVAGFAFHRWCTIELRRERRELKKDKDGFEVKLRQQARELEQLKQAPPPKKVEIEQLEKQLEVIRQEAAALVQATRAEGEDRLTSQRKLAEQLEANLTALQGQFTQQQEELEATNRRLRRALDKDGQTWTEKVSARAPEFKPLDPEGRRTPILSVLNLKGGVGKTTVTANLGAALASLGYRVLLVDLDLQGSLTSLFLPEKEQAQLHANGQLLADFLDRAFDAEFPNLLDYTQPILGKKCGLVATTDGLAYAEVNLTIRWFMRDSNRDPRFLLRKELHLKRVTNSYDIVLLDCPPLINVSCVNALAASDYLLIPVLPSKQATSRVPTLLKRLCAFRGEITNELKVLGILANRTYRAEELTTEESNRMSLLSAQCKDVWGQEVPAFTAFIRQNTDIRRAEDDNRPLGPDDEAFGVFETLAKEVRDRLPLFCRPTASASVKAAKEVVS